MKETVEIEVEQEKRTMYTRFLVTNAYGFGFGDTIIEAKKKCRQQNPSRRSTPNVTTLIYRAKLVTQETTCSGIGGISYFPEYPPIELGEV